MIFLFGYYYLFIEYLAHTFLFHYNIVRNKNFHRIFLFILVYCIPKILFVKLYIFMNVITCLKTHIL